MTMTEGEILAMFLAEKVLRQYRDTPYAEQIAGAFEKLARYLPEDISINTRELEQLESFPSRAVTVQQLEIFNTLARATVSRERLALSYFTQHRDVISDLVVDPYHLGNVNGDWYLFGHCHELAHVRVFLCSRVRKAESLGESFDKPDFTLRTYLEACIGPVKLPPSDGAVTISLLFDAACAPLVRDHVWHPSQRFSTLADGRLRLRLRVDKLETIGRWVLSWGRGVKVEQPESLRSWIRSQAEAILSLSES
ncbi:MAG: WYL domain-containing protein, partial [Myxococcales bacterium]|nr:WYL domain-containing protein [Myxococcales bacterium]